MRAKKRTKPCGSDSSHLFPPYNQCNYRLFFFVPSKYSPYYVIIPTPSDPSKHMIPAVCPLQIAGRQNKVSVAKHSQK